MSKGAILALRDRRMPWHDSLYSLLLLAALVATGVATVTATTAVVWRRRVTPVVGQVVRWGSAAGLALALTSATVHLGWGHRPGTRQSLGAWGFVAEHRALVAVAAVALGLCLWERHRPRTG